MHEQKSTAVAEIRRSACRFTEHRPEECADAGIPLETSGAFDGQRLEDSDESTTCEGKCKGCSPSDMERICQSRGGNPDLQGKPRDTKRLETLGIAPYDSRESLHSKSKTKLVGDVRPTGAITTENVMRLLDYQRYCCALTGRTLTPETAALDHIIPIRFGGEHNIENVQILHKDVNRAKNAFTNAEFIAMCREIVEHTKRLHE
jgi:5-methylcytosine-specific restriction endonuclease McrA